MHTHAHTHKNCSLDSAITFIFPMVWIWIHSWIVVTFKFFEYNRSDSKHTEVNAIFPFRVRDFPLLFYTRPPAPQGIISHPLWLGTGERKKEKQGRGRRDKVKFLRKAVLLVQASCSDACSNQACNPAHCLLNIYCVIWRKTSGWMSFLEAGSLVASFLQLNLKQFISFYYRGSVSISLWDVLNPHTHKFWGF